jgi:hypothetical protein
MMPGSAGPLLVPLYAAAAVAAAAATPHGASAATAATMTTSSPASASVAAAEAEAAATWGHSWDTAGAAWWGDFGYSLLTQPQAEFIANNYFLASLEKCMGRGQGLPTEQGIMQTARQLKNINPNVKTTFYWHTGQAGIACYANNATFMSHPEWFLRDDNGNVVGHKVRIDSKPRQRQRQSETVSHAAAVNLDAISKAVRTELGSQQR